MSRRRQQSEDEDDDIGLGGAAAIIGGIAAITGGILAWQLLKNKDETNEVVQTGGTSSSSQTLVVTTKDPNKAVDFSELGIGGLDKELTEVMHHVLSARKNPELASSLNMKQKRGIILYGPPGTGKTMIARAIAQRCNAASLTIKTGSEMMSKYVGDSEKNIRELFEKAEKDPRRNMKDAGLHVIIIDEIDAICGKRGSNSSNCRVYDDVVTQLLAKMDGLNQLNNFLVIGTTNMDLQAIDQALLRPGRFEVKLEIKAPNAAGRLDILKIYLAKIDQSKLDDDIDLAWIAANTDGFSGAFLEGLVERAKDNAWERLVRLGGKICMNDFKRALNDMRMQK